MFALADALYPSLSLFLTSSSARVLKFRSCNLRGRWIGTEMELAGAPRRVMTLSDQLAVPDSADLRDLLKAHNSRRRRRRRGRGEALTLASAIAAEKRPPAPSATRGGGCRTLLEILRDDEGASATVDEVSRPDPGTTTLEDILSEPRPAEAVESPPEEAPIGTGTAEAAAEGHPERLSLMALLEQTEWHQDGGEDGVAAMAVAEAEEVGGDEVAHVCRCCVCMARHKGAALIPCGHAFCRPCSREVWVRRGRCPLCNAAIVDILDIF